MDSTDFQAIAMRHDGFDEISSSSSDDDNNYDDYDDDSFSSSISSHEESTTRDLLANEERPSERRQNSLDGSKRKQFREAGRTLSPSVRSCDSGVVSAISRFSGDGQSHISTMLKERQSHTGSSMDMAQQRRNQLLARAGHQSEHLRHHVPSETSQHAGTGSLRIDLNRSFGFFPPPAASSGTNFSQRPARSKSMDLAPQYTRQPNNAFQRSTERRASCQGGNSFYLNMAASIQHNASSLNIDLHRPVLDLNNLNLTSSSSHHSSSSLHIGLDKPNLEIKRRRSMDMAPIRPPSCADTDLYRPVFGLKDPKMASSPNDHSTSPTNSQRSMDVAPIRPTSSSDLKRLVLGLNDLKMASPSNDHSASLTNSQWSMDVPPIRPTSASNPDLHRLVLGAKNDPKMALPSNDHSASLTNSQRSMDVPPIRPKSSSNPDLHRLVLGAKNDPKMAVPSNDDSASLTNSQRSMDMPPIRPRSSTNMNLDRPVPDLNRFNMGSSSHHSTGSLNIDFHKPTPGFNPREQVVRRRSFDMVPLRPTREKSMRVIHAAEHSEKGAGEVVDDEHDIGHLMLSKNIEDDFSVESSESDLATDPSSNDDSDDDSSFESMLNDQPYVSQQSKSHLEHDDADSVGPEVVSLDRWQCGTSSHRPDAPFTPVSKEGPRGNIAAPGYLISVRPLDTVTFSPAGRPDPVASKIPLNGGQFNDSESEHSTEEITLRLDPVESTGHGQNEFRRGQRRGSHSTYNSQSSGTSCDSKSSQKWRHCLTRSIALKGSESGRRNRPVSRSRS